MKLEREKGFVSWPRNVSALFPKLRKRRETCTEALPNVSSLLCPPRSQVLPCLRSAAVRLCPSAARSGAMRSFATIATPSGRRRKAIHLESVWPRAQGYVATRPSSHGREGSATSSAEEDTTTCGRGLLRREPASSFSLGREGSAAPRRELRRGRDGRARSRAPAPRAVQPWARGLTAPCCELRRGRDGGAWSWAPPPRARPATVARVCAATTRAPP